MSKQNVISLQGKPEPECPFGKFEPICFSDPRFESYFDLLDQWYVANIVVDPRHRTITLHFLYPYVIDLDRIETEHDLLVWVLHLCEKTWMTTELLREFAEAVAHFKGFKIHGTKPSKRRRQHGQPGQPGQG